MVPELPDYGVLLHWPESGLEGIWPEDRELAEKWIPSRRVFRRQEFDGEYYHLWYGSTRIRIRPSLWVSTLAEDLEVGDRVEVLSQMGRAEPMIAEIREKLFDPHLGRIYYLLRNREVDVPTVYFYEDLQRLSTRPQLREPTYTHQPQKLGIDLHLVDPLRTDEFKDGN
jgi:hypothetical protein